MTEHTESKAPEHNTLFGLRVSALVEMLIGFVILLLVDALVFDGDRFWGIQPHPFWLVILPITMHYGRYEGTISALLATVFYLIGNMPERTADQNIHEYVYMLALNPILWIFFSALLGYIRHRHMKERDRLYDELDDASQREETIAEAYDTVKSRKEQLEVQVAGQLTSSVQAYQAAKAMEARDPRAVLEGVENLVTAILNPKKFSLYIFHDNKLTSTISHGWATGDSYAQEYDAYSGIYTEVVGSQRILCVANEDDEVILDRQGVLAGAVKDPDTGAVVGMLKVEEMDYINLSLQTIETFKALCDWVGASMIFARNYQTAKKSSVVNPEMNLMTRSFFQRQSDYLSALAKRVSFDLTMLVIKVTDANQLNPDERLKVARELAESVKAVLRTVDLAFDYQENGEEYSVLLPATSKEGADVVKNKITEELNKRLRSISQENNFTYMVHSLYEAS